ncbi:right-handed parallel beta-helix repeat-containing protein [endosymbiont of Riftia pachyptila]|uniref:Right handed beta helix domain-containing protein n=1 Tax=endosymbiont of Riftia pachyptila (vent Ph05) TaxID=1048808 RepID=G2DCE3_9GAMM|nr:right-handed parallel beta-helix repeat-containing protein [endosymbiont of Riftia pachyptila]EGV51739.1 hypothetical protein Rifp1Sym_ba00330 [endosymbiont of Riftia pachyptila (vent Ph05)]
MDNRNLLPLLLSISLSGLTPSAYSGSPSPATPPTLGISADQTTAISNGNRLFVDNQIGKSSCTNYTPESRSCSGGSDTAYNSFDEASRAAHAGDTVYVREGRFKAQLKVRNSGTEGNFVTFRNYQSETVIITGKKLKPAIDLSNREYVVIQGFNVEKVGRWLYFLEAHNNIVRDNHFSQAYDRAGSKSGIFFFHASHNRFINNTLKGNADDALSLVDSERNLVEGNSIRNAHHALWDIRCGNYNVLRNNYFYNERQKGGEVYDCDGQVKTRKYNATRRNLIEANEFDYTANSGNKSPFSGIQYAGQQGIIRHNRFHDTTGPGLRMALYGKEARHNWGNRVYNNLFYASQFAGIWLQRSRKGGQFEDNRFTNNLLGGSRFVNNDSRWAWWNQILKGKPVQLYLDRRDGYRFDHTAIISASGDGPYLAIYGNGNRGPERPQLTITQMNRQDPNFQHGLVIAAPHFIDPANHDYRLRDDSPLIDAGTFLTQTSSAGSGTEMKVKDAAYFYDGFGIPGEQGDQIQLDGDTQSTRIISIDYATNTLRLDHPLSWRKGQGVSLKYNGKAPDIGAYE